jgi:solute carrier family 25 iron transporter 28/37
MSIFRNEGARAFYRSYGTQLTMNVPFQAAVVTTYSVCQKAMNPEGIYNPGVHFLAGAVAGGVACAATMPLDVCKTLLNTQEAGVLSRDEDHRIGQV